MTYHVAVSVDIDRFSDAKLKRDHCPHMLIRDHTGMQRRPTPHEVRRKCQEARAAGFAVFPPCDNTNSDGSCAGHERLP